MDRVSVIIPVHNGAKYLKRIAKCVLNQTYKELELIFVENGSNDDSLIVLNKLQQTDNRIKVLVSEEQGTSLARKKGVEYAKGIYTVFMDQDDLYISNKSIERMYQTIKETKVDLCQFSFYRLYSLGFRQKVSFTLNRRIITDREIKDKDLIGVLTGLKGSISTSVWSKIYRTEVLKSAIKNVNFPLYYAEDMFLNFSCLTCEKLKNVCIDNSAYYIWKTYTGFSSKDSSLALFDDYETIKPIIYKKLKQIDINSEIMFRFNQESLYFMCTFLKDRIYNMEKNEAYTLIEQINNYSFIKNAKSYVNNELEEEKKYEGLMFLASDFTPEEFYDRFKNTDFDKANKVNPVKRVLKRLIKAF